MSSVMKGLTETECGQGNPLMRLGQQLESNTVEEYMNETRDGVRNEPGFRMESLLSEMRHLDTDESPVHCAPKVADLISSSWTQEFLESTQHQTNWAQEFLGEYQATDYNAIYNEGDSCLTASDWVDELTTEQEVLPLEWVQHFVSYDFSQENPFLGQQQDLVEDGKAKLKEGDLPSAVLMFEAAVQADSKSTEAWTLLGLSQAENENDVAAIIAFKETLELSPTNLEALMALAVSYANERRFSDSLRALEEWIQQHPDYYHLMDGSDIIIGRHNKVTNLYLQAADFKPDPDTFCGLGILLNLCNDYEKAAEYFRKALALRPSDHLLWNKLGATLANGDRSEEAISAYHKALTNSPGFIRARYNLGVSCVKLQAYTEATQHFLSALNFQTSGRGPHGSHAPSMSETIWRTLKLALMFNDKSHLLYHVDERNLNELCQIFNVTK